MTKAMIIAKDKINEFEMNDMKGPDIDDESITEYPGFKFSRTVKRFEHELFGPLDAKRIEIKVKWEERGRNRVYSLSYTVNLALITSRRFSLGLKAAMTYRSRMIRS